MMYEVRCTIRVDNPGEMIYLCLVMRRVIILVILFVPAGLFGQCHPEWNGVLRNFPQGNSVILRNDTAERECETRAAVLSLDLTALPAGGLYIVTVLRGSVILQGRFMKK